MENCLTRHSLFWKTFFFLLLVAFLAGLVTFVKLKSNQANDYDFKPAPTDPEQLKAYEIDIFREYLRIPSAHPDIDYKPCVAFLTKQARSLGLPVNVYYPAPDQTPMVVITWTGSQPELPSIVLNSHMDVVPAYADQWTHPPFAGEMDADGRIFGRGAQDMKSYGTQYLAAIRALRMGGVERLKRTVHVTFAPSEEIGGIDGWRGFIRTDAFRALNVGFELDEGDASDTELFPVWYADRGKFTTTFEITGRTGHGAKNFPDTVGDKVRYIVDRMMDLRRAEEMRWKTNRDYTQSDITTINLTMLKGGIRSNVVPQNVTLVFDVRVAIDVDLVALKRLFERWAKEAGDGVTVKQDASNSKPTITKIDSTNPFWMAMQGAARQLNITLAPTICPGHTDAGYFRDMNIPALGLSTIVNLPVMSHRTDEFITVDTYFRGIDVYKAMLTHLANV